MEPIPHTVDLHQEHLQEILQQIATLAADYLAENERGQVPIRKPLTAQEIRQRIPTIPPREGRPLEDLFEDLRQVLDASVRTTHPRFANQLFVGSDLPGIIGDWITALLDTTMATYEMSPVATVMERDLIQKMCEIAGFEGGEGIFTAGGSISNLMAVLTARQYTYPNAFKEGMINQTPPALFTSREAHYSLARAANILGLGIQAIYPIDVDEVGRVKPESFREQIARAQQDGRKPFFLCATAGTTVASAFDPIPALADICEEFGIWLHVDAAYGGGVLLSPKYRHLMDGVERADSLTWCPHKMMGTPLVNSAFLIRHQTLLQRCLAVDADYIFHQPAESTPDLGPLSLQCGRRIDSIKTWLTWQVLGDKGFEERIDNFFALSAHFTDLVREREYFELLREPQGTNVLFHYIPPALRGMPRDEKRLQALDEATRRIREAVNDAGKVMINYGPVDGYASFRMVHINPRTTFDDLPLFLDEIERLGEELYPAQPHLRSL